MEPRWGEQRLVNINYVVSRKETKMYYQSDKYIIPYNSIVFVQIVLENRIVINFQGGGNEILHGEDAIGFMKNYLSHLNLLMDAIGYSSGDRK